MRSSVMASNILVRALWGPYHLPHLNKKDNEMKISFIKVLVTATCFSALFGAQSALACAAGYTCFTDYETGKTSRVQGNNDNWGNFGWNNRADYFYNNGRVSNNCLYNLYDQKGSKFLLKRGQAVIWRNVVSSNKWTSATSVSNCPKQ